MGDPMVLLKDLESLERLPRLVMVRIRHAECKN